MRCALLALAPLVAVACTMGGAAPRGELMVAIDTDMTPGVDFDRLEIDLKVNGQNLHTEVFNELGLPGLRQFPLTYAIVGNADPTTPVQVRVSVGRSDQSSATPVGEPKVLNEIVATVPTGRVALLRAPVDWLCVGSARPQDNYVEGNCPEGTTCIAGDCTPWGVDAPSLPTYSDALVFGGGGAKGDGACLDTLGCFAQGYAAAIDPATCTIDRPAGGAGVNVAIVARAGEGGICGPEACLVPLDAESSAGWRTSGDRIELPPALCAKALGARATGVAVTTACAPKTAGVPTCGPWSVVRGAATLDAGAPDGAARAAADAGVLDASTE